MNIFDGWMLWHRGATYNADGNHPCPLTGQSSGEGPLLQVAAAWQNETAWHTARPELTDR